MALYVTLWKYTKDGLMEIRKTPKRFEVVKKIISDAGGKLIGIYGLMGKYDLVTIVDMPNDKVAATTILKVCSTGRITSETMPAIPIDELLNIMKKV
jgi:uncharacterized protein with GYD domain